MLGSQSFICVFTTSSCSILSHVCIRAMVQNSFPLSIILSPLSIFVASAANFYNGACVALVLLAFINSCNCYNALFRPRHTVCRKCHISDFWIISLEVPPGTRSYNFLDLLIVVTLLYCHFGNQRQDSNQTKRP